MNFPEEKLIEFFNRAHKAVKSSRRTSRKCEKLERYEEIQNFLLKVFPSAKIYFYGSRKMGLAGFRSDLDVYVDVNGTFYKGESKENASKFLNLLKDAMKKSHDFKVKVVLHDASCPVLQCTYLPMKLKCDVTFTAGMGVRNTDLVHHLFRGEIDAQKVFHTVRIMFQIGGIEFKRYQIVLMVIFYLQQEFFMPSISKVQRGLNEVFVDGWETQFDEDKTLKSYRCDNMGYFKDRVLGFFDFYATFDFANEVIFPYYGRSVSKINYPDNPELSCFPKNKLEKFKRDKPMAMASLMSFDYNVTYDVGKNRLQKFINFCQKTSNLFQ